MLSYQHAYHAGNMADVHKHAVLATALDYLAQKSKPMTYVETHAGRGLYALDGAEAQKTGEAAQGILRVGRTLPPDHPLIRACAAVRDSFGPQAYPGSPLIARHFVRPDDSLHLAELHPAEYAALVATMGGKARLYRQDGAELAMSICPPTPRRGLMLIDPSWELKEDYKAMPALLAKVHRIWPVGVLILWFPLLVSGVHKPLVARLRKDIPGITLHGIGFPPARPGHGMIGSGLAIVNPPWALTSELERLSALFPSRDPGII
ncbi:23S rRNA (adenine(2030)-N(6))-methyltransferase RlmJ [Roseisalinus antarcticus]|uniref:Ribosomal RNA large subunit methyltransferase J n=1 Tax=Roseisalinus antarcticus TaxID=254357 RepID=A0A1Y5STX7_9RHOB|nr:23S rRNA (adenine(2030)-N(6))-methyltransferase RlmJ [Roseisalinus antarcticus]SLN47795.1 Ribosomal RNA large subunit methyltransferase J [Roseisalinus antarcticus]